jgi:SAGA-associated factor 73
MTRKAPPKIPSSAAIINLGIYNKIFASLEKKKSVKLDTDKKKSVTRTGQTEPGNWQDSKAAKQRPKIPSGQAIDEAPASALVNTVDGQIATTFVTGKPLEGANKMVQCKHCRKPLYRAAAPSHIRDCLKKKQQKLQKKKEAKEAKEAALRKERNGGVSPDPPGDDGGKKHGSVKKGNADANGTGWTKKNGKKRKAEDDAKGPTVKKKKEEPKPKVVKAKGPVEVEKQCGVILPNGSLCARSLTCKSHSMGAKRAVPGRSMPYDILLAQYQKKNQAKLQSKSSNDNHSP